LGQPKRSVFLRAASGNPNPEVVQYLLDNGGDLKKVDEIGATALHLAASLNSNFAKRLKR